MLFVKHSENMSDNSTEIKDDKETLFDIEEELKKLPGKPGVYIMHDEKDAIIYVGKAISLKKQGAPVFSEEPQQRR